MADIVVGVKRYRGGSPVYGDDSGEANAEIHIPWIEIGGHRLTAKDAGLCSVAYENSGSGVAKVTIVLIPSSFRTVNTLQEPDPEA